MNHRYTQTHVFFPFGRFSLLRMRSRRRRHRLFFSSCSCCWPFWSSSSCSSLLSRAPFSSCSCWWWSASALQSSVWSLLSASSFSFLLQLCAASLLPFASSLHISVSLWPASCFAFLSPPPKQREAPKVRQAPMCEPVCVCV